MHIFDADYRSLSRQHHTMQQISSYVYANAPDDPQFLTRMYLTERGIGLLNMPRLQTRDGIEKEWGTTREVRREVCKLDWERVGSLSVCVSVDFVDCGVTEGCLDVAPLCGE